MARIASNRRLVHPTSPNITIPVTEGDAWVFGPGEGRWWRWLAWWVIPLGLVLLIAPWYLYFTGGSYTTPPAPATYHAAPPTRRPAAARTASVPVLAPTVDLTPVGRGLEAVANAVSRIQPPPPPPPAPAADDGHDQQIQPMQRRDCADSTNEARCRLWNQQ